MIIIAMRPYPRRCVGVGVRPLLDVAHSDLALGRIVVVATLLEIAVAVAVLPVLSTLAAMKKRAFRMLPAVP